MANTIIKMTEVDGKEMWINVDEFIILKMEENKEKGFTEMLYSRRGSPREGKFINIIEKPEEIVERIKNG